MRQVSPLVLAVCANGILSAMAASVDQQLQIGPDASQRIVRRQVEKFPAGQPTGSSLVQEAVHEKIVPAEPEVVNGNFELVTAGSDANGNAIIGGVLPSRIALAATDGRADGWQTSGPVFLVPNMWNGMTGAVQSPRYNDTQGNAVETCTNACGGVYVALEGNSGTVQQTIEDHIPSHKYMLSFMAMSKVGQPMATMEVHLTGAVSSELTAHQRTHGTDTAEDAEPDFSQDLLPYKWTSYEFEYQATEPDVDVVLSNQKADTTLLVDKFDVDPCKTAVLFLHNDPPVEVPHVEGPR